MDWNNSKILAKETGYTRRFLESFFIYFDNHAFNGKSDGCRFRLQIYFYFSFFCTTIISLQMMFVFPFNLLMKVY